MDLERKRIEEDLRGVVSASFTVTVEPQAVQA